MPSLKESGARGEVWGIWLRPNELYKLLGWVLTQFPLITGSEEFTTVYANTV